MPYREIQMAVSSKPPFSETPAFMRGEEKTATLQGRRVSAFGRYNKKKSVVHAREQRHSRLALRNCFAVDTLHARKYHAPIGMERKALRASTTCTYPFGVGRLRYVSRDSGCSAWSPVLS